MQGYKEEGDHRKSLEGFGLCFKRLLIVPMLWLNSDAKDQLCLNHAINLSILSTFCNQNETNKVDLVETGIPTTRAEEPSISGEYSDDEDIRVDIAKMLWI